jgi:hypothetical protein
MPDEFKIIWDGAAMARLLRSPSGPVGRMLIERATKVQTAAKAQIAPHNKTGCLEGSLVKRAETLAGELAIRLQSDTTSCSASRTSYSLAFHNGSDPHDIPGAFGIPAPFGIGGQFSGKFHPGTAPVPFLRDNLHLAG